MSCSCATGAGEGEEWWRRVKKYKSQVLSLCGPGVSSLCGLSPESGGRKAFILRCHKEVNVEIPSQFVESMCLTTASSETRVQTQAVFSHIHMILMDGVSIPRPSDKDALPRLFPRVSAFRDTSYDFKGSVRRSIPVGSCKVTSYSYS